MRQREGLRDQPAEREAGQMGPVDTLAIEQVAKVTYEIVESIGTR